MRRVLLIVVIVALVVSAIAGSEEKFSVSGVGSYPISQSMTSMWLAGPDHRPLLVVYFHGPEGWHNTKWKVDSKFDKGKPGWAELQSEKVTLRLSMNTETEEAGVQSSKFKVSESNTFLVLHTSDSLVPQRIISLGAFDFPASKDQPASALLLRANPELVTRINSEIAASPDPENYPTWRAALTEPGDADEAKRAIEGIVGIYRHSFANGDVQGDKIQSTNTLEIKRISNISIHVDVHLEFYNGHECSHEGVLSYRRAGFFAEHVQDNQDKVCVLEVLPTATGVEIEDPTGMCKLSDCGMRGGYNGATFSSQERVKVDSPTKKPTDVR